MPLGDAVPEHTIDYGTWSGRRFDPVDAFLIAIRVGALAIIVLGLFGTVQTYRGGGGISSDAWVTLIIASLSQGAMYGLIALGYSMVYGVLGFINFAHGEVFMIGGVTGVFVAGPLFDSGLWDARPFLSLGIVLLVAVLVSMFTAIIVERVAYRRLRNSPRLIPLITSIGVSFFLQYAVAGLIGVNVRTYPSLPASLPRTVEYFGHPVETTRIIVFVVAIVAMVLLWYFVTRTRAGRSLRAVAEDKEIAGLMGIDVDRTIMLTFAVGGAMAGLAAVMYALLFRGVFFFTGFLPGIKAFTAAVLGGIGNLPGAMFGGLLLGLFEGVGPLLVLDGLGISSVSQLRDVVAFSALVLMLVFRPSGLLGERLDSENRA
jgi:branched-chain amino acid transport system permease protein